MFTRVPARSFIQSGVMSGASIGVVISQAGLATTDDYLRAADAAMYRAKSERLGVYMFGS